MNIRDFYDRTFWRWVDSVTEYGNGYVLNYSGLRWLSGANQLWLDDPRVMNYKLLMHCLDFFRPYMAEWSVLTIPEIQPGLKEKCLSYGCYVRWNSPIMVLDELPRLPYTLESIPIYPVNQEPLVSIARNIIGESFQMDASVNLRLVRPEHHDDDTIRHYVAYCDGHPAAASTLTYTDDLAGIWNVGTRRIFRRRGLASALMGRMCQDALTDGYPRSMLMASTMGRPLYARMGYRVEAEVYYLGYSVY